MQTDDVEELQSYSKIKRKQLKKYQCCLTGFLCAGLVLVISASFTPKLFDTILGNQAAKSAQLTQANEKDWKDIPGSNNISIWWN